MKKAKSSKRQPANKGTHAPKDVDGYFVTVPEAARANLKKIRDAIRSVVPREATEVISYRIPAFKYKGLLVWYGAFSEHCSLFPTASIVEMFKDELKGFKISKGTIQFPNDKPVPIGLIKRMAKARVRQKEN